MTEEEIAARIEASNAKKGPKAAPIDNTILVEEFRLAGGRVQHIMKAGKGLTVAFKAKNNRFEIATAITHSSDTFAKKIGTKTAIEHFLAGKTVFLPRNNDGSRPTEALQLLAYL